MVCYLTGLGNEVLIFNEVLTPADMAVHVRYLPSDASYRGHVY